MSERFLAPELDTLLAEFTAVVPLGPRQVGKTKRSNAPAVSRGFHQVALDVKAQRKLLVAPVERSYTLREGIEVMHPLRAVAYLAQLSD